jgi:tRNA A37 methylthiotransferase MiaB
MNSIYNHQSPATSGRNVFIDLYCCSRREIDTQKIYTYLQKNQFTIVRDPVKADYIILMTCGATKGIADVSFKLIKKYKEYDVELIVAGCIPETHKEELNNIFTGKTISIRNLDKIDDLLPHISIKFREIPEVNARWESLNDRSLRGIVRKIHTNVTSLRKIDLFILNTIIRKVLGENFFITYPFDRLIPETREFSILISRGCIHNCTYCIIKKGIGPLHSKPPEQCIQEIFCGLQQGYRSFVLDSDDSGPYGIDIGTNLPSLLRKVMEIQDSFTIKISHSHPRWLIKYESEFDDIFRQKRVNNIFASVQSGNDRILRLMGRPYATLDLVRTLSAFRKSNSDLKIGVDLIVGFPSETEEEFLDTLNLFNSVHFDYGILFPFSCHEGTKASTIEPNIPKEIVDRRMRVALRFLKKNNYFAWRFHNRALCFFTR